MKDGFVIAFKLQDKFLNVVLRDAPFRRNSPRDLSPKLLKTFNVIPIVWTSYPTIIFTHHIILTKIAANTFRSNPVIVYD